MHFTKWFGALLVSAVTVGASTGADTIAGGTIKSIDANSKTFILTDSAKKEHTFSLGENVIVNRAGKEGKNDLKAGDAVHVSYDKGLFTWTSNYVLVQEGTNKDWVLIRGNVKGYDPEKKEMNFTNESKQDSLYAMGAATVRLNLLESKMSEIAIGDQALLIVEVLNGKSTLKCVLAERAK